MAGCGVKRNSRGAVFWFSGAARCTWRQMPIARRGNDPGPGGPRPSFPVLVPLVVFLERLKAAGVRPALFLTAVRAPVGRDVALVPLAVPPNRAARLANVLVVSGGPPAGAGALSPRSRQG